jgi:hypothetical protein
MPWFRDDNLDADAAAEAFCRAMLDPALEYFVRAAIVTRVPRTYEGVRFYTVAFPDQPGGAWFRLPPFWSGHTRYLSAEVDIA